MLLSIFKSSKYVKKLELKFKMFENLIFLVKLLDKSLVHSKPKLVYISEQ